MSLASWMIRVLDRRGGRRVLAWLLNSYARRLTRADVKVAYDGVWLHAVDGRWFADRPRFDLYPPQIAAWPRTADRVIESARDQWFHSYRPLPGHVIVDVGAGDGGDVLVFAEAVGPTGRVVAIEAHPVTFCRLQAACRRNGLDNVTCVHAAVTDKPGVVTIEDGRHDASNRIRAAGGAGFAVRGDTLDALLAEAGVEHVDFVKMNIEGAERQALRGMTATLACAPHLCIACHDFRAAQDPTLATRDEVSAALSAAGFEVLFRDSDPREYTRDHAHAVRRGGCSRAPARRALTAAAR
jgi:FkbM family methyltransferase